AITSNFTPQVSVPFSWIAATVGPPAIEAPGLAAALVAGLGAALAGSLAAGLPAGGAAGLAVAPPPLQAAISITAPRASPSVRFIVAPPSAAGSFRGNASCARAQESGRSARGCRSRRSRRGP